jgi:hypothetical protein
MHTAKKTKEQRKKKKESPSQAIRDSQQDVLES